MAGVKRRVESYGLDPAFERMVVALACSRPRFYGRIGRAMEPEALAAPGAQLALQAAHAIAQDSGHGPESSVLVMQRLKRWMQDGRVTQEQITGVFDLLEQADETGLAPEDAVVDELTPLLQRRVQSQAVEAAMDEYAKRGDFARVAELIGDAARLGKADTSVGTLIGADSFAAIEGVRHLERLATGVSELDLALDGGLWRGALGMVVGGTGDGKSMFLSHAAASALQSGLHVLYATLELPEALVLSRIKANLTGVPINAIMDGSMEEAKRRLVAMMPTLGRCYVKDFTPHATTVEDLREWVKGCEQLARRQVDVLIVDYADKLTAKVPGEKDGSEYRTMRVVYEGLRVLAVEHKFFGWTASQKRRSSDKTKKKSDTDDVADSMHKSRVADVVVTLNLRGEENEELLYYIAKYRIGKAHASIGPLPHDFARGRMVYVNK